VRQHLSNPGSVRPTPPNLPPPPSHRRPVQTPHEQNYTQPCASPQACCYPPPRQIAAPLVASVHTATKRHCTEATHGTQAAVRYSLPAPMGSHRQVSALSTVGQTYESYRRCLWSRLGSQTGPGSSASRKLTGSRDLGPDQGRSLVSMVARSCLAFLGRASPAAGALPHHTSPNQTPSLYTAS
jgi:hypothetical protein